MRDCWREGLVPLLTLHDELDFSFHSEEQADLAEQLMRDTIKFTIPVKCDREYGVNWADSMRGRPWTEVFAEIQKQVTMIGDK
jgi:hypothetical protein